MSETLIQSIEKALGREPPISQNEKEEREYVEKIAEEYRAKLESGEMGNAEAERQSKVEKPSSSGETLASDSTYDFDLLEAQAVPAVTVGLAILLVIMSFVTFRLARRNRMLRESGYFNNQAIGNMARKQETVLWFRRQSPDTKKYKEFVSHVQRLVEEHNDSGDGKIELSEAWRKQ